MQSAGHGGPDTELAQVPRQSVFRFVNMLRRLCAGPREGPSSVRNGALCGVARRMARGEGTATARVPQIDSTATRWAARAQRRAARPAGARPWPRCASCPRGIPWGSRYVTYL